MGTLPGIEQLRGLVKGTASFSSPHSCSTIPSSANLPVFGAVSLSLVYVSVLLVLAGGCSSSCICFPVFFLCSYPRLMTQRGAEFLRSNGGFEWAGSELTGHFPEWGWGCLTRWNTHVIWTCYNTNICIPLCSIAAECYEIMEGSDLAPHCMKITMNEQMNRKMLFQVKMGWGLLWGADPNCIQKILCK